MLYMAIKIEKQLKTRGSARLSRDPEQSNWKKNFTRDEKQGVKFKTEPKPTSSTFHVPSNPESSSTRNRDIKCYKCQGFGHMANQCPNKRSIVILNNGDVVTDDEEDDNSMSLLEDASDDEVVADVELTLVVQSALNVQARQDDKTEQPENIFHTRCHAHNKVCSMIIDGGSCTNVASTTMVKKLELPVTNHPRRPYKLQWFNDRDEIRVTKQVLVSFRIGKYEDEVLCDVAPKDAGHLCLGRL